ncbi:unnamed protein product, partial [Gongylonema pulchrum]|uniref:Dolichyl-diphosphooligosaccharide--protein glycosyltransferase subunit 1 n=1 Tax=Gongylonema pulchrum TaxID=637853 RepID=A0A183EAI3_9BILA
MLCWRYAILLLFAIVSEAGAIEPSPDDLSVSAERTVDISTQVVKVIVRYELVNSGNQEINSFLHVVHENEHSRLAYITASDSRKDTKLRVSKIEKARADVKKGYVAYKVELLNMIPPSGKAVVTVEYHLVEYLEPFPTKITQADTQFVIYKGNAHVSSIYPVTQETTVVLLPNGKLESHTTVPPTRLDAYKLTYGPYSNQKPFTFVCFFLK